MRSLNNGTMWRANSLRLKRYISPPARRCTVAAVREEVIWVDNTHWCDAADQFISLTLKKTKHGSSSAVVVIAWQCGLRPLVSSIILASSFLPSPVTARCVLCNKLWMLSSSSPLDQNTLHKIGTNKLWGQPAVKDSSFFSLPSAAVVLRSAGGGGRTLEEKWLRAALSMAIQSVYFLWGVSL